MKHIKTYAALIVAALIITACTVPEVVTVQNPDGTTGQITNQVVDPKVIAAIETLKAVNTVTAPQNPYSPVVTILLGIGTTLTTAWGAIATFLNNRKKNQIVTLVKGVEKANNPETKKAIETQSIKDGNQLTLDAAVQKIIN